MTQTAPLAVLDPESPFVALSKQADLRVSVRRTLRAGTLTGTPVEDPGITPDHRHEMTRLDVLENDVDLVERAGQLLAAMPRRRLDVTASLSGDALTLEVDVTGADRLDVYVDDQPRASADATDEHRTITVDGVPGARVVRVEGFAAGELVAARTLRV
ncbi:hypothetical protein [Geodermatophilus obscurus]|uniref:Uncharacterized protein n=1 Tax=Geodermatophilus obscurus (strain ATCC 25078 / DSM 43160 / JCM 3152 / CCUG 61914 / KCC A-0152 / KCTC 9177 / NBRC 13315 / NRRL B-3577 / G-20) TaxID=526225 RepID=D2SAH6_GEOOG|nr:hypothetical protein [Geodermatophilus obscurus]ADB73905.1 hypothetical protein Gobs_1146 [Geodermatophilus obscurus DSM 43160]